MEYISLRQDRKISLYGAIFAFIISLLAGIAARNPIGILFLRAIISMFLFGAVMWGALYVLRRYIPDLLPSEKQVSGSKEVHGEVHRGEEAMSNLDFTTFPGVKPDSVASGDDVGERRISQESMVSEKAEKHYFAKKPLEVSSGIKMGIPEAHRTEGNREGNRYEDIPSLDHLFEEQERDFIPDVEVESEKSLKPRPNVGEYIDVGRVRIPNEPEILAKAIKKMMKENSYE